MADALVRNKEKTRNRAPVNFCEVPKITERRVPDIEIRNFENRSPSVNARRVSLYDRSLLEDGE